jgi:hypothetical protein
VIPQGAYAFRYRVLSPHAEVTIGDRTDRMVHRTPGATVVIDYLTEEQTLRLGPPGSTSASGMQSGFFWRA